MFDKKYLTLFIGKNSIEPGFVTVSKKPSFEGFEAIPYTPETLEEILTKIHAFSKKTPRCVLSEELVYVTSFVLPKTPELNREKIIHIAEESIPEDLKSTAWDFQTLQYNEAHVSETTVTVEVAVVASTFSQIFIPALQTSNFTFESIIPESYALSGLVADLSGVSLIIEAGRDTSLLVAAEAGIVWATYTKSGPYVAADIERFINFLVQRKDKKIQRIIFSHCSEELILSLQPLQTAGYELLNKDLNSLISVAIQEKVSGKDEEVLNINIFQSEENSSPFRFWQ